MNDCISRKAAINAICRDWCNRDYCGDCFFHGARQAIDVLKALPSENVQPVVRCKDCKYFDSGTDEDGKPFFKCLGWVYGGTSEDDFCSHGERKDG